MPWFPDFASAVELSRQQTRTAAAADPVAQYFTLLNTGDTHAIEDVWPGEVTLYDPLAGRIHGHRELRHFVQHNQSWLGALHPRTEKVAATVVGDRAVVEFMAHLHDEEGVELAWPIAVVAESPDDQSVSFRTYCRAWPITGEHHRRPAILSPGEDHPGGIVARYQAALAAGDAEAIVSTFAPDGYYREPSSGPQYTHQGTEQLRAFFAARFSSGGIGIQHCAVTDDGTRCALEYTCLRWGTHDLPPQAGIAVYERGADGLLTAVRGYDDITPPAQAP
ncbi:MAG TPA: nuclear transport factor 2 family protein [Streptosporangiaceae bacterium]|jgi:ketosteroid isomerase-like protein|nr:nuclear transport factor 2 family protein [Streptosporangiaceae bacterium]